MLTGQELLDFVLANQDLNQNQLADQAGYNRTTKTGKKQVLVGQFNAALHKAQGLNIRVGRAPGKVPDYITTVHKGGMILIGKVYAEQFGVNPGDKMKIVLEDDCIRVEPLPAAACEAKGPALKSMLSD